MEYFDDEKNEVSFRALLGEMFTVLEVALYDKMEEKDSIYFVLQKRQLQPMP